MPRAPAAAAREILIVFRKEITELFRDYRTVLASIAVPLLLFPLLAAILAYGGQSGGIGTPAETVVAVSGPETAGVSGFLQSRGELNVVEFSTSDMVGEAVTDGGADVGVILSPTPDSTEAGSPEVAVVFDNINQRSQAAGELVTGMLDGYLARLTTVQGTDSEGTALVSMPFSVQLAPMYPVATGAGTLVLSFLLPVIVLISAAIGPVASAADLGAGEKERGTLESLLGSPARRSSILMGKFAAVATMGFLGIVSFVAGAGLAYVATRTVSEGIEFTVTAWTAISVAYAAVLAALTFAAIEFLVSLYARSSKAAQTFSVPVLMLASAAGYAVFAVDMRSVSLWYYNVPVLNLGLLVKGAVLGVSHPAGIAIASLWVAVYLLGAFIAGKRVTNRESFFRSV